MRTLTRGVDKPPLPLKLGMFAIPLITAVVLFGPMLVPDDQYYVDWVNSYWLILAADSGVWPLWFFGPLNGVALLEPWFAYYAGYWFFLMASVREVGVDALLLYRVSYLLLSVGMACGVYFLALRSGAAPWASALLASIALAIPYYLTNAYGRGAYTEFIFVSLVPIVIAGCVAFFSARRLWEVMLYAVIVVGSAALLLTTHLASLIILFDLTLAIVIIGAFLFLFLSVFRSSDLAKAQARLREHRRRILALSLLLAAAALLALPQTGVAVLTAPGTFLAFLNAEYSQSCGAPELSTLSEVFAPFPRVDEVAGAAIDLKPQTVTWLALWAGIASVGSWRFLSPGIRLALILSLALLLFCIAMTSWIWLCTSLPDALTAYQFPYRFVTYVSFSLLVICGVLLASHYLRHGHGVLRGMLLGLFIVATVVTVIGGFVQTRSAETYPRQANLTAIRPNELPPTWYAPIESFRQIGNVPTGAVATVLIEDQTSYRVIGSIECSGAKETILNVADTRPLTLVSGVRVVGSTANGLLVVDTSSCKAGEFLRMTVEQASEKGVGRSLTFVVLIASVVFLTASIWLSRRGSPEGER